MVDALGADQGLPKEMVLTYICFVLKKHASVHEYMQALLLFLECLTKLGYRDPDPHEPIFDPPL